MPSLIRAAVPVVAAMVVVLVAGCGFDRKWNRPAAIDAAAAADPLAGHWQGTWTSERTGHTGTLRAIITPVGGTTYHAEFDATYMEVLRFGYAMTLHAKRSGASGGTTCFQGEENLGPLAGGVYRYSGTADRKRFMSTYDSSADDGRFEMTRALK